MVEDTHCHRGKSPPYITMVVKVNVFCPCIDWTLSLLFIWGCDFKILGARTTWLSIFSTLFSPHFNTLPLPFHGDSVFLNQR